MCLLRASLCEPAWLLGARGGLALGKGWAEVPGPFLVPRDVLSGPG